MTLDEAIKIYTSNAEYERTHGCLQGYLNFRQLAGWLKDYKRLKEQEPKTGHWIDKELVNSEYIHQDRKIIVCSECNFGIIQGILGYTNFCPNCGCRMVEPQESEGI